MKKNKDHNHILVFVALGLGLAYVVSKPLRRPSQQQVGTPLEAPAEKKAAPKKRQTTYAEGTIYVAGARDSGQPLFVIARPAAGGAPVAVQKISAPAFPLEFKLTVTDNMMGTEFFNEDITVVARLDADGNAGPKQPKDRETTANVKAAGPRTVKLIIP